MSKRNFILLIIVLILTAIAVFGFFYFQKEPTPPGGESTGTNFISQFNPFGDKKPTPPTAPSTETPDYQPNPTGETPKMKLTKISSMPIAGFAVFSKERLKEIPIPEVVTPQSPLGGLTAKSTPPPTEFAPALRYVDRMTGNIYQTFADKIEERKFSTTVIPKVYEAYFGNKGESVVMRYLKTDETTIQTFIGNLPKEHLGEDSSESNEVTGSFLPENVSDVSISPDTLKIFYLFNVGDVAIGTTLSLLDNKK